MHMHAHACTCIHVSRFVSAGDACGQEHPATPMSSYYAGHSGCEVT